MARRLWARFEFLPFRYGMALLTGTVAVVALLVVGVMTLGDESAEETRPSPVDHSPMEAAVPAPPTWGAYVPPRHAKPTPMVVKPHVASLPPRPRPTHSSARPSPAITCPPNLKKWMWAWQMCKRRQSG